MNIADTQTEPLSRGARVAHANLSRGREFMAQAVSDVAGLSARQLAGVLDAPDEEIEVVVTLRTSNQEGPRITGVVRGVTAGKKLVVFDRTIR